MFLSFVVCVDVWWTVYRSTRALPGEVLHLQVLVDAVDRALTPEAGLLDAAERGDLVGDQPVLMPTMPASSAAATRQMRSASRLKT